MHKIISVLSFYLYESSLRVVLKGKKIQNLMLIDRFFLWYSNEIMAHIQNAFYFYRYLFVVVRCVDM